MIQRALIATVVLLVSMIGGPHASGQNADFRAASELDTAAYLQIGMDVLALGDTVASDEQFDEGFNAIWRKGRFSHVGLKKTSSSAAEIYAQFDTQLAGNDATKLEWRDTTAILTMSGADTIASINSAYGEITKRP